MACFVLELPHSLSILLKISATFQMHCNVFEIVFYKLFFVYWILRNDSPTLSFYVTLIAVITNGTMLCYISSIL